jgi:hypothetical protein
LPKQEISAKTAQENCKWLITSGEAEWILPGPAFGNTMLAVRCLLTVLFFSAFSKFSFILNFTILVIKFEGIALSNGNCKVPLPEVFKMAVIADKRAVIVALVDELDWFCSAVLSMLVVIKLIFM